MTREAAQVARVRMAGFYCRNEFLRRGGREKGVWRKDIANYLNVALACLVRVAQCTPGATFVVTLFAG